MRGSRTVEDMESRNISQKPAPAANTMEPGRFVRVIYLAILAISVLACALYAYWEFSPQAEFAQAADRFGYLQMAQDIRRGAAPHGLPRFTMDSPHARLLLDFLRQRGIDPDNNGALGGNAYHYVSRTNQIICQYPPGVGIMLSLFPQGRAVFSWQTMALCAMLLLAGAGFWLALATARPHRMLAAGLLSLTAICGLRMLGSTVSYSIDLVCLPLLVSVLAGFFAERRDGWIGFLLATVAGAALGWASVIRLASALFLPGLLVLAQGSPWRRQGLPRTAGIVLGFLLAGLLPLMIHQNALTGSPFHSTYTPADTAPPELQSAVKNVEYYFWGQGSSLIGLLAAGAAAFVFWVVSLKSPLVSQMRIKRITAVLLWWVVPTGYFLLHPIPTPYYQLPSLLVVLGGMTAIVIADSAEARPRSGSLAIIASCIAAAVVIYAAAFPPPTVAGGNQIMPDTTLPSPLRDERAWIVGDRLVGTLWYYHGIVAHRLPALDPGMQRAVCHFVLDRGDPLYMMVDNPVMYDFAKEIISEGAQVKEVGTFADRPEAAKKAPFVTVYQVFWPK